MDMMTRRRAMMAQAEDTEPEYSKIAQTIRIKNGRSGTVQCRWVCYRTSNVIFGSDYGSSALAAGADTTSTTFATDGKHIWLYMQHCTTVKYNGTTASFKRSGNNFQVEIPENYDPDIPLVFS